jgi:hypothetical protein
MIEFFSEDNLDSEYVYSFYLSVINSKADYYTQLGYNKDMAYAIQDYDRKTSGIVYAKEDEKIIGFVIYNNKRSLDKMIFDIQMEFYESTEVFKKLYEYIENFAKSLNCNYINQTVLVKDLKIINNLESINFKKEFCLMYKRV